MKNINWWRIIKKTKIKIFINKDLSTITQMIKNKINQKAFNTNTTMLKSGIKKYYEIKI